MFTAPAIMIVIAVQRFRVHHEIAKQDRQDRKVR